MVPVSHNGRQGWAYSQYLTARLSGRSLAVAERLTDIPTVVYQAPVETVGSAVTVPAITGTLIARPAPRAATCYHSAGHRGHLRHQPPRRTSLSER